MKLYPPNLLEKVRLFRKASVIGLDIGASSIKVAQFDQRKEGLVLSRLDLKEIAPTNDPALKERETLSALKELLQGIRLKQASFIVSFNGPEVGVRVLTVPPMPQAELIEAVKLESKNYFPFPLEDALIDIEICGEVVEKGVRKHRVALAVAPRKKVEEVLALLKKLGIQPVSLIPVPCAFKKLVEASDFKQTGTRCFVDLGGEQTELAIFKGRELVFSRKLPVTGNDFSRAMTGALVSDRGRIELEWEEAEKIKREEGIPSVQESRMIQDKVSTSQILSMLHSPLEHLVSEIERCFHYYREETGGEPVDSVVLFGGGALLKGLASFLSEELGLEVRLGNPLEGLRVQPQIVSPEQGLPPFVTALGTAFSLGKGINLLPPEIKEEVQRAVRRATVESLAVSAILLLAFLYIGLRLQRVNIEKRIAVAKWELESLGFSLEKVEQQNLVEQVLANEPYWEEVFKELSHLSPEDIYLTGLETREKKIYLKGVVTSKDKESVLSGFILGLEQGIFRNVKLVQAKETTDKSTSEFELECWVD